MASRFILERMLKLMDDGVEFAVATVAETRGSVPGKRGAKMIVFPDGSQIGTVGGAGLEEKAKALARQCIAERRGGIFSFDLAYYREGALDSLCGGTVKIVIEHVPRTPHVLICGGGHVGLAVAKALEPLEYAYSVLDDRPEYASRERFPEARSLFAAKPEEFFGREGLGRYTHVLILGYSHRLDAAVLYEALHRFHGYIGLIASKMKKREMFHRLKALGVTDEQLSRVEAPIGVKVGAVTPAEIAVEIVAGLIRSHRAERPGENPEAASAEPAERSE
ncbi:MAG: XdhC family protein [Planctomycetes bacterium]|nr:XdhC family protein [Planctomycetota bacterium]